ncbi:ATP-grasp domain-containing protein [Ulvibacter sp.]|nr:ATP-grasp domain-containing protein [Ulvibacter sp.]
MSRTILVSGASGIVGYGVLRSLREVEGDLVLIGTTIFVDSVAQGFCDIFEKAIPTNDDNYIDWLLTIIKKYKVDLIIPGIEADLYSWTENLEIIERSGAIVLTNNTSLVKLCKDKWDFYNELRNLKSPYLIPTSLDTNFSQIVIKFGLPFLLKPRKGFASKGIVKVTSKEVFNLHKYLIGDILLVQPIIGNEDEEYTTSAFCDGKGSYYASMTLRRKLSKDGYTDRAETCELKEIDGILNHFCAYFKPKGPTNFQFRLHNGVLMLLEINPRISSATSIRTAFGYNESQMVLEYYLEGKRPNQPSIRTGRAVRYTDDKIFYDDRNNI